MEYVSCYEFAWVSYGGGWGYMEYIRGVIKQRAEPINVDYREL